MAQKKKNHEARTFRLPPDILEKLDAYCEKNGAVKGAVVEQALRQMLEGPAGVSDVNLDFTGFSFTGRDSFFEPHLDGLEAYPMAVRAYRLGFAMGCSAGACDAVRYITGDGRVLAQAVKAFTDCSLDMKRAVPDIPERVTERTYSLDILDTKWRDEGWDPGLPGGFRKGRMRYEYHFACRGDAWYQGKKVEDLSVTADIGVFHDGMEMFFRRDPGPVTAECGRPYWLCDAFHVRIDGQGGIRCSRDMDVSGLFSSSLGLDLFFIKLEEYRLGLSGPDGYQSVAVSLGECCRFLSEHGADIWATAEGIGQKPGWAVPAERGVL